MNCKYDMISPAKTSFCAPVRINHKNSFCSPVRIDTFLNNTTATDSIGPCRLLWLEITKKCNLNCLHCYSDSSSFPQDSKMGYSDWVNCLRTFSASGITHLQFTGGEPTLYEGLPNLIIEAKNLNYEFVEVFTNLTCITDNQLSFFKKYDVSLAFSIYGHNSSTHDQITQTLGSFKKTIDGIIRAHKKDIKIRASIVVIDNSIQELTKIQRVIKDLGVTSICIDEVRSVGRGYNFCTSSLQCINSCAHILKLCVIANGDILPCVFQRTNKLGNYFDHDSKRKLSFHIAEPFVSTDCQNEAALVD